MADANGANIAVIGDGSDLEEPAGVGWEVAALQPEGVVAGADKAVAGGGGGHEVGDGLVLDLVDGPLDGDGWMFLLDGLLAGGRRDCSAVRHQPEDWVTEEERLTRGKVMSR